MRLAEDGGASIWIPATFLLLAGWFLLGSGSAVPETEPTPSFDRALIEIAPPREVLLTDPPSIEVAGFDQRCTECHDMFESRPETEPTLLQHDHIQLDHGLNSRCFNCHSLEDHSKLVLHGTELVGFERAVELCAKCHGPTYRDWEAGHARAHDPRESWVDREARRRSRLLCIGVPRPAPRRPSPSYEPLRGPQHPAAARATAGGETPPRHHHESA